MPVLLPYSTGIISKPWMWNANTCEATGIARYVICGKSRHLVEHFNQLAWPQMYEDGYFCGVFSKFIRLL